MPIKNSISKKKQTFTEKKDAFINFTIFKFIDHRKNVFYRNEMSL